MENEKTPLELMGELLAQMTLRAMEAERQVAEYKREANEWYQRWRDTDGKLTETAAKLADVEKKLQGSLRKTVELSRVYNTLPKVKVQTECKNADENAPQANVGTSETRKDEEGTETPPNTENAQNSATNAENIQAEGEQHGKL